MPEVGQWGPEIFVDRRGRPTPLVTVTIYDTDGVTPATLYADQAGIAALANPLPVGVASTAAGLDDRANGSFYAPPGPYVMAVVRGGVEVYRSPVTVGVDTPGGGGGGAPTTADYLVGTAQGGLSAEIVVGPTPAGELGGTWGSPTVDALHSGSTHAAIQAAAEATAAADATAKANAAQAASQPVDADLTDIAAIADVQGDIMVRGAAGWERLAKSATSTDILQAGAAQPLWGPASAPGAHASTHADGGADEVALAGEQITSGTVADARIAATIARDAEVAAAYQPLDADLTDLAAIADAQGDIIVRGAAGWERLAKSATATDVLQAGASQPGWAAAGAPGAHATSHQDGGADELALDGSQITTGTVADARIDSAIARDAEVAAGYQPLDSDLTAVAALTTTSFGRAFLELANAAAGRTALALGTAATAATGDFDAVGAAAAAQAASQPVDGDLTALAALTTTSYGRSLLEAANASALRTLAGTVIGTDVQAFSAVLAATTASFLTADETKLDGIEALADVTDAANVNAAGAVMESDYDANTILRATADNTPAPLTMGPSTILVRLASGDIIAGTPAQLRTLLAVAAVDVPITDAAGDFTATEVEGALAELQTFDEALESLQPGNGTTPVSGGGFVQIDLLPDIEVDSVKLAGGVIATAARLATAIWLPAVTYANGSSGVGATLTANTLTSQSFARSGTVVTVTSTTHGISPGAVAQISASSDTAALPNGDYTVVTIVDANNFTITGVNAGGTSGMTATVIFRGLIDGVLPALNDDVVIKNQVNQFQNGIYTMTTEGTGATATVLTRRVNADQAADYAQVISVTIADGQAYGGAVLISSPLAVTMGTTAITFVGVSRPRVTPVDVRLGPNRDRRRYETDFEELDAAILVAGGASQRIPGTIWTVNMVGTLATATQQNEGNVTSGAIDLATGTTTTGFCAVQGGMGAIIFDSTRRYSFACRYKTPTQSSAAELFVCKMGYMVSLVTGATQTAGIYFEIPSSGNILAVVANASTGLAGVDTGIAGSTGYRTLWWEYDPITGAVTFFTTVGSIPVLLATISTNIPTVSLATGAQILKAGGSGGVTSRSLRVDYLASDQIDNRNINVS